MSEICGLTPHSQTDRPEGYDDVMWAVVKAAGHFYDMLEPMPGAKKLFNYVFGKLGDDCQILSGIPKPKRGVTTAGEDKINWSHRVLSPDLKVNIVFREEKKNFCTGKDCILVDDLEENIKSWEKCGGTGIHFTDAESCIEKLKEFLEV